MKEYTIQNTINGHLLTLRCMSVELAIAEAVKCYGGLWQATAFCIALKPYGTA